MSYDFSVKNSVCDHLVTNERYVVDSVDFVSLRYAKDPTLSLYTRAPINSAATLKVFIGGSLVSPTHPVFGYTLIIDDSRPLETFTFKKVVFNKPCRLVSTIIELEYYTLQSYCLKCLASGQVNDLTPAKSGSLLHIIGNEKLIQRSLKWILTSVCKFYPNFVCPIKTYIGRKFGLAITDTDISQSITTSLQNMQSVQAAQATVQTVTPTEVLQSILGVSAVTSPTNPTLVNVAINISAVQQTSPGNQGLPINFNLKAQS